MWHPLALQASLTLQSLAWLPSLDIAPHIGSGGKPRAAQSPIFLPRHGDCEASKRREILWPVVRRPRTGAAGHSANGTCVQIHLGDVVQDLHGALPFVKVLPTDHAATNSTEYWLMLTEQRHQLHVCSPGTLASAVCDGAVSGQHFYKRQLCVNIKILDIYPSDPF